MTAADQPHLAQRAELGRPTRAEERVGDSGERAQRKDTGLAHFADYVDVDGPESPHRDARLKPAEVPGKLVADQAISLREREPPDSQIADLRQDDPAIPVHCPDERRVDRPPHIDRQIVPGAHDVVRTHRDVVHGGEGGDVGREDGVAVLAQRRPERTEHCRALGDQLRLLQLLGLLRLLLLLQRQLSTGLRLAPWLLLSALLLEAGLDERGLLLLNAGLLQVDLLTEVLLLRRNRHAGLPDRVQDAHLTNRVQIEGRLDPRQLFDLLCAGCGNGRKPRGLGRRLHRLGQPTLTRRGHLGHWGPRRVLWLEARHWWLQGACPRNRNGLIGTHPSAWL